jgi:energy-coupling factor transporter transmembrane protein EcfT
VNGDNSLISIGWSVSLTIFTMIYIRVMFTLCDDAHNLANERLKASIKQMHVLAKQFVVIICLTAFLRHERFWTSIKRNT